MGGAVTISDIITYVFSFVFSYHFLLTVISSLKHCKLSALTLAKLKKKMENNFFIIIIFHFSNLKEYFY